MNIEFSQILSENYTHVRKSLTITSGEGFSFKAATIGTGYCVFVKDDNAVKIRLYLHVCIETHLVLKQSDFAVSPENFFLFGVHLRDLLSMD